MIKFLFLTAGALCVLLGLSFMLIPFPMDDLFGFKDGLIVPFVALTMVSLLFLSASAFERGMSLDWGLAAALVIAMAELLAATLLAITPEAFEPLGSDVVFLFGGLILLNGVGILLLSNWNRGTT